jgi:hypothetical protein
MTEKCAAVGSIYSPWPPFRSCKKHCNSASKLDVCRWVILYAGPPGSARKKRALPQAPGSSGAGSRSGTPRRQSQSHGGARATPRSSSDVGTHRNSGSGPKRPEPSGSAPRSASGPRREPMEYFRSTPVKPPLVRGHSLPAAVPSNYQPSEEFRANNSR